MNWKHSFIQVLNNTCAAIQKGCFCFWTWTIKNIFFLHMDSSRFENLNLLQSPPTGKLEQTIQTISSPGPQISALMLVNPNDGPNNDNKTQDLCSISISQDNKQEERRRFNRMLRQDWILWPEKAQIGLEGLRKSVTYWSCVIPCKLEVGLSNH